MVDAEHIAQRQQLFEEFELLADGLPRIHRQRMLGVMTRLSAFIERVEDDGACIDNSVIQGMIEKLRDR